MTAYDDTPTTLTNHILQRDGCPLHYWLGGSAERPLLALLHGAGMDHRMFNDQVAALLPHFRVLVWDARGHGRSQPLGRSFSLETCAADLLALLDHLGEDQIILGGQSMGGLISQIVYRQAPARMKALLLIGATPLAKAYSRRDIWLLKASVPLISLWPYNNFTRTVARTTAVTPPVQAYALQAIRQIPRDDFLTIWRAVSLAVDTTGWPGFTINVPLLLTHGDQDSVGSIRRDNPPWAQSEPQATYEIIPNAGHNANQDNPAAANTLMTRFLQTHQLMDDAATSL